MSDLFRRIQYALESEGTVDFDAGLEAWLIEKAKQHDLCWLLAHADDGVIWGQVRQDGLHTSHSAFKSLRMSPPLDETTLQQARLFGEKGELHLWRTGDGWQMRVISEGTGMAAKCYDEPYLLWGDGNIAQCEQQDGFVLLRQGAEGLLHAPPLPSEVELPLCLVVRHVLGYDPDGQAYIVFSRLVSITSLSQFKEQGGQHESEKS